MPRIEPGSWTDASITWIANQRAAHPEATAKELERICRKNYPYQQRKGWAYKAWLKAMRIYFRGVTAPDGRAAKRCSKTPDLFEKP
jgi:hypothetical protein